jgi:EmrB/QacA subfamily drug resistance transporter
MPAISADAERIDRDLLRLMGVLLVGAAAALLDTTIVSVAIDDLTRAFDTTVSTAQWATTGYLLAMAAAIPMMGWLTDQWGARRVWLVTLWLFLLGSALCALAWSIESLIAFRVVQGLGGGLILPLVQAILAGSSGPRRMGRAMGLIGIPGQLAPILGPVLGGVILGSLGWRWIFLVNVPLCLIALLLAWRHLHVAEHRRRARLDGIGALLLILSIVAILTGLAATSEWKTAPARPIALLASGAVLLAGFVAHAWRRGDRALLDMKLLRYRSFSVATVMMFLSGVCLYGPMLLLPLFYQQARGLAVAEVGLLLAPQGLGLMAALWVAGRWADRIGPRIVAVAGVCLAGAGLAVFVVAGNAPIAVLSGGLVALGGGLAGIGVAVAATSYRDVEPVSIPRAASLLNVVQRIGASFGTVVIALILHQQLAAIDTPASEGAIDAAFARTFAWALGFLAVVLVIVLFLPAKPPPPPLRPSADTRNPESRTTTCEP